MNDLQFAAPEWGYALWAVVAVVAGLVWLERRSGHALDRFVAAPLRGRLVAMPTPFARWLGVGLLALAAVALVLALMRPQWGVEFVMAPQVGAEIMIALDVSKSMLAEDVAPNRLERAKAEIRDLLPYLDGDQVGLIAFAGRASVVCPLTPDFSFLRLVLDQVDSNSVSRGGTRLEEPIRKAVAGFGPSGDLARVILLITDGEDHDSFPLDAARDAAERGIRILAVGFGDEAGSRIAITDPVSGARVYVQDADGRPVISRLDGELLRELAMITEGAYIPAGTGVLDLESIFEAHIRPLMRGEGEARGKTVRKDGFQWGVLLALLALVGSALTRARRIHLPLLVLCLLAAQPIDQARAQASADPTPDATSTLPGGPPMPFDPEAGAAPSTEPGETLDVPVEPRDAFNAGLDAFEAGTLDPAERLFEAARSRAGGDGELRFRATFNLGWIDVVRADALIEAAPEDALAALERAADWFRESIALRPNNEDARRNLEIILARSLALADSLEERESGALREQIEALVAEQRGLTTEIRGLVERLQANPDPNAADMLRAEFKALAVREREILGTAEGLAEKAGTELDGLQVADDAEQTPEDRMRKAQLTGVLQFLHRAQERIGQARSQLRQRQGERANRRAAAALGDLERALDQLRDPVQLLDALLQSATRLHAETTLLARESVVPLALPGSEASAAPAWLTQAYLADRQSDSIDRSGELDARLRAGLEQRESVTEPEQLALLERVAAAQPHIADAVAHFVAARDHIDTSALPDAAGAQRAGIISLAEARERFLELKGLIEVAYADEIRLANLLGPAASPDAQPPADQVAELAPALAELQARNLARLERMSPMLAEQRARIDAGGAADDPAADPEQLEAQRQQERERLDLADAILAVTESSMRGAHESLVRIPEAADAADESRGSIASSVRGLENLRRLFFSIVEHIREAARQQATLGDRTETAAASDPAAQDAHVGPVRAEQSELAARTEKLADALHEQALADPAVGSTPGAPVDPAQAQAAADKLAKASEHVLLASQAMTSAATELDVQERDFGTIRGTQDEAVEQLAQALALLQPEPPPDQQQGEQGEQEQDDQSGSGEQEQQSSADGEGQQDEAPPDPADDGANQQDPTQLLQSVRDREAERHRRDRGRSQGYEPVEKDW